MTFGEKLNQLRREAGMSQEELAEALDVSRQSISRWEQDACAPSMDNLARLGKLFHVPIDTLVDRQTPAAPQVPPEQVPAPDPSQPHRIFTWKRVALCALAVLAALLIWLGPQIYRELTTPYLEEWEYEEFDWDTVESEW